MAKGLKHYKQARYKAHRKPINKTVLIGVVAAVVIFALSIALGTYLSSIAAPDADDSSETDLPPEPSPSYNGYGKIKPASVGAYPLSLEAYTSDEEADRAILRANGALIGALSIDLLSESGAPSYKSDVYRKACSAEGGVIDLSLFLQKAEKNGITVCSVFDVYSLGGERSDTAQLRRALELALLSEAYGYGIREVLLCGIEEDDTDVLYEYVLQIKRSAPELAVGIAVTEEKLSEDTVFCAKLADIFDYIAVDLSEELAACVSEYDPAPVPSAHDSEDGSDNSSEEEKENESPDYIADGIDRASRIFLQYGAKAYIDLGDGCAYCTETAVGALKASGIENFIFSVSEAYHK